MAYKFTCPSCESEIKSNFLKPGEAALCRGCGDHVIVPDNAVVIESFDPRAQVRSADTAARSRPQEPPGRFAGKKAWNPRWVGVYAFFGSFVVAGILWIINYHRFGNISAKQSAQLKIAGETVCFGLIEWIWGIPGWVYLVINLANGMYFAVSQKHEFAEFIKEGGQRSRFWKPIGIQFACVTVVLASIVIFTGFGGKDMAAQYKGIHDCVQAGDFGQARVYAAEIDKLWPRRRFFGFYYGSSTRFGTSTLAIELMDFDQPDTAWAILKGAMQEDRRDTFMVLFSHLIQAAVAFKHDRIDEARDEIETYLLFYPNFPKALALRERILSRTEETPD